MTRERKSCERPEQRSKARRHQRDLEAHPRCGDKLIILQQCGIPFRRKAAPDSDKSRRVEAVENKKPDRDIEKSKACNQHERAAIAQTVCHGP